MGFYIHVIKKTMCPPGYHHNGLVATFALATLFSRLHIIMPILFLLHDLSTLYVVDDHSVCRALPLHHSVCVMDHGS